MAKSDIIIFVIAALILIYILNQFQKVKTELLPAVYQAPVQASKDIIKAATSGGVGNILTMAGTTKLDTGTITNAAFYSPTATIATGLPITIATQGVNFVWNWMNAIKTGKW